MTTMRGLIWSERLKMYTCGELGRESFAEGQG